MPSQSALPADIQELVSALNSASRQAEELVAGISASALVTAPAEGGWSAAQCLNHLAKTNFAYSVAMRTAVAPELHLRNHPRKGPIRPGLPTRWFLSQIEPPVRRRFLAPQQIVPPSIDDGRQALKDFLRSQNNVLDLLMECHHLDLNRVRFVNPFVRGLRFTVGAGFLIIAAHNRRHLAQAVRVVNQPSIIGSER